MSLKKLGRYDLVRVLGKGAMGLVYEGRDPNLDRRVAIKTIKVENLSDEAAAEYEVRFRTEARSAARLQHPNIVSVYDSDRDIDIAYLVMEFVQGDDLKHHLDKGEVYTLKQTLSIMDDLLSALSYAHSQGVVHRDIKPANLLVIAGGRIKLADFGVARIQDSGDATRTQGTIVGTLKYMSPEQLEGKPIDARTDLFAAGVVLYQLVTGQRPFDGDTDFAVIQNIVNHQPAPPTSFNAKLPPALDAVVAKSLAKSRDARYATAQEFAHALQAACKQASDITIAPVGSVPAKGSNTTWTATMMPGESLVATNSGVSTSGTSASLVTQEVELVYWKDIKDTSDIEDLQGFLVKFPAGIYADLARRRLKNLGVTTSADAAEATQLMTRLPMTQAQANEKTVMQLRPSGISSEAATAEPSHTSEAVAPIAAERKPEPNTAALHLTEAPAPTSAPAAKKSGRLWLAAAAVVGLVGLAGVAFNRLSGSNPATDLAAQTAAPLTAASAAASSAPGTASSTASSTASATASPTALTPASATTPTAAILPPAPTASSSALAAVTAASAPAPVGAGAKAAVLPAIKAGRPTPAASKTVNPQVAKKASAENEQPAKQEQRALPEPVTPATPAKPATAVAANPRAACEDRVLFGFQTCMSEQCAKPAFFQHPTCVERRAMDERRRDAERNR